MSSLSPKTPACITILYGTQSGTAYEASQRIGLELSRRLGQASSPTKIEMFEFDAVDVWSMANDSSTNPRLFVFVVATTGQGDVPASMRKTWSRMLLKTAPRLESMTFAVFGLGDSNYENYNTIAKMLHNRLVQLGAHPVLHRALGDDQDAFGYLQEMVPWIAKLADTLGIPSNTTSTQAAKKIIPPLKVETRSRNSDEQQHKQPVPRAHPTHTMTVVTNSVLTASDHFQEVRHIELAPVATESPPVWGVGDVCGVYAPNPPDVVDKLLDICGYPNCATHGDVEICVTVNPNATIRVNPSDPMLSCFLDRWMPLRDLFTHYLDICGVATTGFLNVLQDYATDEEEVERLGEFCSVQGTGEFTTYCVRERRNIVEVLDDFPTTRPPLDVVVSFVRPARVRWFSISSAPGQYQPAGAFSLTVGVVEYKTPYGRTRRGLASSFLGSPECAPGTVLHVAVDAGAIPFDDAVEEPIIFIGPGTGIAPCRGFLHARKQNHQKRPRCSEDDVLFVGCRNEAKDFLYGDEFRKMAAVGANDQQALITLHTAFSRDTPGFRVYVQNVMQKEEVAQDLVRRITQCNAHILISGNAKKMPADVRKALIRILVLHGAEAGIEDEDAAVKYVKAMTKQGRYCVDAW
eukprot:PhM_4_TR8335/c0_g1_i1/m.22633